MPSDEELVRTFLAERDTPCPSCGYNLRGAASTSGPECGAQAQITLVKPIRRPPVRVALGLVMLHLALYLYSSSTAAWLLARNGVAPVSWARWQLGKGSIFSMVIWYVVRRRHPQSGARFVELALWALLCMLVITVVGGFVAGWY
jgi:hypothetical protein